MAGIGGVGHLFVLGFLLFGRQGRFGARISVFIRFFIGFFIRR
jgi:hypothetical protein